MKIDELIQLLEKRKENGYTHVSTGLFNEVNPAFAKSPIPEINDVYYIELLGQDMHLEKCRVQNPIKGKDYQYLKCRVNDYCIGDEYSKTPGEVVCSLFPLENHSIDGFDIEDLYDVPFHKLKLHADTNDWHLSHEEMFDLDVLEKLNEGQNFDPKKRRILPIESNAWNGEKHISFDVNLGIMYLGPTFSNTIVSYDNTKEAEVSIKEQWRNMVKDPHVIGMLIVTKTGDGHIYIENSIEDSMRHIEFAYYEYSDQIEEVSVHAFENWSEALKVAKEWSQMTNNNTFDTYKMN